MESILKALHELAGVRATIVFDLGGRIVARDSHAAYDKSLLDQVAGTLVRAVDSIQLQHSDWDAISARYSDGKLLLRNLGSVSGSAYMLAVVSDATLNLSFAAVAMRVAATKLKRVLEGGEAVPALVAASSPSLLRGVVPVLPRAGPPPSPADAASLGNSGLSWSKVNSSGIGLSSIAVIDPATSSFLTRCSRELARYVGPMAKVFIKETVRRICPVGPFTLASAPLLVAELAHHIPDPTEKSTFRRALERP